MRTLRLSEDTIDLGNKVVVALGVRLRASGVPHAADAATMLELNGNGPTVWTKAEKHAVAVVVRAWLGRDHDPSLDDELGSLQRALLSELAS